MNEKEAELIGMHVGDGTLYQTKSGTLVWEMRGGLDEKDYYDYVSKLIKNVFNVEVKPKYRGPNSYGVQTTNKLITKFFLDKGFKPGKKVYTVRIPDFIKKDSTKNQIAFVRGLFDTDGCIYFDKNRTAYSYYPRIEFGLASGNLVEDLFELFRKCGFEVYKWKIKRKDGMEFKIRLSGFLNLKKWIKEIKPANKKHNERIAIGLSNKNKVNLKNVSKNV